MTDPATSKPGMAAWLLARLKQKKIRYWITAFAIFVLAIAGSPSVYKALNLDNWRAWAFQSLLEWSPRPAKPKFVKLVLIDDKEYWLGEPGGRAPIKRDYLARLVDKLKLANAHVIALDFDARLPDPTSMEIPKEYEKETCTLIKSIKDAAADHKKIVLTAPIEFYANGYRREPDIYQANGLCVPSSGDASHRKCNIEFTAAEAANVTCGYIALPYDRLVIPAALAMADGTKLDSFALALARAHKPDVIDDLLQRIGDRVSYANYMPERDFQKVKAWLLAGEVLRASDAENKGKLQGSPVIVGANWRSFAADRGPRVDAHDTPIGRIVGSLMLANFGEALLDERTFGTTPRGVLLASEILFGAVAVIAFAVFAGFLAQVGVFAVLILLSFLIQWTVLYFFGVFFDVFIPLLGLALHALADRLIGSYEGKNAAH